MTVFNPDLMPEFFASQRWDPLLIAHNTKSSQVLVDKTHHYVKKTKRRHGGKRDAEFFSLATWGAIMDRYRKEAGLPFHVPTPYLSDGRDLIMGYAPGIDLDRLLRSARTGEGELEQIFYMVGQLSQVKENESLYHNDFTPRHLLLDGGLYIIDIENGQYVPARAVAENKTLEIALEGLLNPLDVRSWSPEDAIARGKASVPKTRFFDEEIMGIIDKYGDHYLRYLQSTYFRYKGKPLSSKRHQAAQ